MPWLPFFSNCDGFDSHIIIFDALEYSKNCTLYDADQIRIVNPLPTTGTEPVADHCSLDITCRYDEPLASDSITTRWYQIRETKALAYITRDPIPIENFWKLDDSDVVQTFYNSLIEDGSDDVIFLNFVPGDNSGTKIPRLVEIDFLYYQKTADEKIIQSVNVYMKDYDDPLQPGQVPEVAYNLRLNYKPLNFLNLINNFQFAFPIYILLFNLVSLILILAVLTFWLFVMLISRHKKPPALRFKHNAMHAFGPPVLGFAMSAVPLACACVLIVVFTRSTFGQSTAANWSDWGSSYSNRQIIQF
jgi:hypothetical protein